MKIADKDDCCMCCGKMSEVVIDFGPYNSNINICLPCVLEAHDIGYDELRRVRSEKGEG